MGCADPRPSGLGVHERNHPTMHFGQHAVQWRITALYDLVRLLPFYDVDSVLDRVVSPYSHSDCSAACRCSRSMCRCLCTIPLHWLCLFANEYCTV